MNKTRTCHICGTVTNTWCPTCEAKFSSRRATVEMTGKERVAELALLLGPLEMHFSLVHQRIEELVGRPVWTHEIGLDADSLRKEAHTWNHTKTTADIVGLLKDKPTIVIEVLKS